jgi:hypothetical protein
LLDLPGTLWWTELHRLVSLSVLVAKCLSRARVCARDALLAAPNPLQPTPAPSVLPAAAEETLARIYELVLEIPKMIDLQSVRESLLCPLLEVKSNVEQLLHPDLPEAELKVRPWVCVSV